MPLSAPGLPAALGSAAEDSALLVRLAVGSLSSPRRLAGRSHGRPNSDVLSRMRLGAGAILLQQRSGALSGRGFFLLGRGKPLFLMLLSHRLFSFSRPLARGLAAGEPRSAIRPARLSVWTFFFCLFWRPATTERTFS